MTISQPAAAGGVTGTVNVDRLNVRSGPGTEYTILGKALTGDSLTLVGRNSDGSWLAVEYPAGSGEQGWVTATYVTANSLTDSLPVHTAGSGARLAPANTTTIARTGDGDPVSNTASGTKQATKASGLAGTLAFQSNQGGTIYAYDLATGDLRSLTTGFDPAISPDGQTVAFTRQGVDGGLYLINTDGSNERRIYTGPPNMASPKWRADGGALVVNYVVSSTNCRDMGGGRCTPEIAFVEDKRLADENMDDYAAFTAYEYDLGVVNVDGSNFHSLSALHSSRAPDWGAAGIVYQSSDGMQLIQDTPGAASQVIAYDMLKPMDQDPDMQRNGGRIVFQRQGASHSGNLRDEQRWLRANGLDPAADDPGGCAPQQCARRHGVPTGSTLSS